MSQHFLKKYMLASLTSIMIMGASQAYAEEVNEVSEPQTDETTETNIDQPKTAPDEPEIDTGEAVETPDTDMTETPRQEDQKNEEPSDPPVVKEEDGYEEPPSVETKPDSAIITEEGQEEMEDPTDEDVTDQSSSGQSSQGNPSYQPSAQRQNIQQVHDNAALLSSPAAAHLHTSFKYNPLAMERFEQITTKGTVNQASIQSLEQKVTFKDNEFLNRIQQDSDYFRYQAFRPLAIKDYYKNLDKQVLGLITEEIGSMPDLKSNNKKPIASRQHEDKEQQIEQKQTFHDVRDDKGDDIDNNEVETHPFGWLIFGSLGIVFAGVVYFLFNRKGL
ncbi:MULTISPECIES: SdrH family protein [unclassified Staphylococcus]|uniref:SdrH family protein n=1 Tax=unclassified Staphylococcus TaxID=91994 RepID=UPI0021CF55C0|nr:MULTISPECIES: SdrH family protein [unclassified Staphylococcus]UXR75723.1 SdrH family protein [Staphylococcus sp. IVB6233]UXR79922.1 SdrH family protein [Staphylococcus sp. IVB6218]